MAITGSQRETSHTYNVGAAVTAAERRALVHWRAVLAAVTFAFLSGGRSCRVGASTARAGRPLSLLERVHFLRRSRLSCRRALVVPCSLLICRGGGFGCSGTTSRFRTEADTAAGSLAGRLRRI